jgi:16S rRNA (guanine966-N2)-methyltransferase
VRIIAGVWRGRTIHAPRDRQVRPTGDRAREAWMSRLQYDIPGARVVDLFAGSGALGLEALSRGALHCDFVDLAPTAVRAIHENAETLGASAQIAVHRADALRFVEKAGAGAWHVAFVDPPYNLGLAPRIVRLWLATPFARILSVEHDVHEALPTTEGTDVQRATRTYGGTAVTIYRVGSQA